MGLKSDRANATPLRICSDKSMGFIKFAIPSIRECSAPKPLTSAQIPKPQGQAIGKSTEGAAFADRDFGDEF